jgi:hypothetical protein
MDLIYQWEKGTAVVLALVLLLAQPAVSLASEQAESKVVFGVS